MVFYKFKCTKCGYELEIPEESQSVICGSCGNINHISRISSFLRKHGDTSLDPHFPGSATASSYNPAGHGTTGIPKPPASDEDMRPLPDEEEEFPEQGRAMKIITLLFILAPFIAMAVEFFKLPPYAALAIIGAIIIIVFTLKKRS